VSGKSTEGRWAGSTVLDAAIRENREDIAKLLREHGAKTGAELDEEQAKTPEQENSREGEQ
jgi:hypothetical protein